MEISLYSLHMEPDAYKITVEDLRDLIGLRVRHGGIDCQIIEVLEDGPSLVLQEEWGHAIQPDQYGEAHRRVPHTLTVPIFNDDKTDLNPAFLGLDVINLDDFNKRP
jgi:hypothetical protein